MLERMPRKQVAPDVAALDAIHPRHDHQIGIRADEVERIELNAAQSLQHRPRAARAAAEERLRQPEVPHQQPPALFTRDGHRHRGGRLHEGVRRKLAS